MRGGPGTPHGLIRMRVVLGIPNALGWANAILHLRDEAHAMISDQGMQALRSGAALVRALPSVRLRIRAHDRVLAEVRRPPFPDDGPPQVPACVFSSAVARAHALRAAGQPMGFMSLPEGVDPAVDIGVADQDRVVPGGIVRTTLGRSWLHVAPVALPGDACLAALGSGLHGLSCQHDRELEVTLLQVSSPAEDWERARAAVDTLTVAIGRCAVADLEILLRTTTDSNHPRH